MIVRPTMEYGTGSPDARSIGCVAESLASYHSERSAVQLPIGREASAWS